jgi:hypothetical protein
MKTSGWYPICRAESTFEGESGSKRVGLNGTFWMPVLVVRLLQRLKITLT